MSVITVQVGQCGVQVGTQFYDTLCEDLFSSKNVGVPAKQNIEFIDETVGRHFRVPKNNSVFPLEARAVLVDTEKKAVEAARGSSWWTYRRGGNACSQTGGAGNNWAQGYRRYGQTCQEEIMESVRWQAEKCDNMAGFITFLSLAGGTGSGLGAYVTECLREEYPHSFLMTTGIWPHSSGEVVVQTYNALLTLSHLPVSNDGVLLVENDHLQKTCRKMLDKQEISMDAMNEVCALQLASFLLPSRDGMQRSQNLGDTLQHLVPSPEYRLLNIRSAPVLPEHSRKYSVYLWPGLVKSVKQMVLTGHFMEEGMRWDVKEPPAVGTTPPSASASGVAYRCLSQLAILRGSDCRLADTSSLANPCFYPPWVPDGHRLKCVFSKREFHRHERSISLLTNGQTSVAPLDRALSAGWRMFQAGAYLHQYARFGLEKDDFLDSFASLEQLVATYNNL